MMEVSPSTTHTPPMSDAAPEDSETDYRPMSRAAVVGLLVGLVAPLGWFHPALVGLAILGVAVSGYAVWSIASSNGELSGTVAAWLGLCLSLFSLGLGPARFWTERQLLRDEAARVGRVWLETIRAGDIRAAHQWTLAPDERVAGDETLDDYYASRPARADSLEAFGRDAVVRRLVAWGPQFEYRRVGFLRMGEKGNRLAIRERYRVLPSDAGDEAPEYVCLTLQRRRASGGSVAWQVTNYESQCPEVPFE